MKGDKIQNDKFDFLTINDCEIVKISGQHPSLKIEGLVSEQTKSLLQSFRFGESIQFRAENSDHQLQTVFTGIINQILLESENEVHRATIICNANSVLMDLEKHTRTFQNKKMTYNQLFDSIKDKGDFILPQHSGQKIGSLIVQYEETDWNFAKRIAGRLNTVVIPDCILDTPYISIGVPNRKHIDVEIQSYKIKKNIEEYFWIQAAGNKISENDMVTYEFNSREILNLCDSVTLDNKNLFVYAARSFIKNEELVHCYELRLKSGFVSPCLFNDKIIGASLNGKIHSIEADKVQVSIDNDITQSAHCWFAYATPFSVPDGAGWYFMPEIGDEIRLRFPTEREETAYVSSSVHVSHGKRSNPEVKYLRTIYGQEIKFAPKVMTITDGAGSTISLSKGGISVSTSGDISMTAKGDMNISATGKIELAATKRVAIRNNTGLINVGENIDVISQHTRIL